MPLRTLRLTEYRPRDVRLRRADVDALLAAGGAVEVLPTRRPHRYRVTAQGVAGVLLTPNLRVVIRPKIPAANLFLLLDPDAPPDLVADTSTAEPGMEVIDFLARRLADGMRTRAAAGLHRGYVEHADRQPFLQGRLDVAAQAREPPAGRTQFHVARDEFTADTAIHRLTRATAQAVLASPFMTAGTRAALRAALDGYVEVTDVPLDPSALDAVPSGALNEDDRSFIDLCRLLVHGMKPGERPGEVAGPAFLLDLERVFERYVDRGLRAHRPDVSLQSQEEFVYHAAVPAGQPPLVGRPDLIVRCGGTVKCVIDAKWKPLDGPPPAADVHQALAYAVGLGCRDVRLVYPGRRSGAWAYRIGQGGVTLTVHALRVRGPRDRCLKSLGHFARRV